MCRYEARPCDAEYPAQCRSLTRCISPLTYESVPNTRTTDRVCQPCPTCTGNTYAQTIRHDCGGTSNATVCVQKTPCTPGVTFESDSGKARDRATCLQCINNCHLSSGSATRDRTCTPCSRCSNGEYVATACSATSDTRCAVVTQCGLNEYESNAPTSTSDRQVGQKVKLLRVLRRCSSVVNCRTVSDMYNMWRRTICIVTVPCVSRHSVQQ